MPFRFEFAGSQIIFFDPAEEYFTEEMARASEEFDCLDEGSASDATAETNRTSAVEKIIAVGFPFVRSIAWIRAQESTWLTTMAS